MLHARPLALLPLLLLPLLVLGCKGNKPPAPRVTQVPTVSPLPDDEAAPESTDSSSEAPDPRRRAETVAGVILSRDGKLVTAEVEGRVEKIIVAHGQRVSAGTPLVVVDDTEMKRQLDAARGAEEAAIGELRRAETARAEAGRQARQQKSLFRDGAVSRDAVAAAGSSYAIADAGVQTALGAVKRAKAAREHAEQAVAKTTIVAPMDGVITLVKVSPGQMIGRGMPIARIFDPADLWVRFAISPELRDRIRDGAKVKVTPLATASRATSTRAAPAYEATIRVIGRTLEPPLQLAVVEADLDDGRLADHDSLLGTMVDVRIE